MWNAIIGAEVRSGIRLLAEPSMDDVPYWDDYYTDYMADSLLDIRRIRELCEEYGINLIVFTNPLYYRTYQESKHFGYDQYLGWLAGAAGSFYNFSGENAVTMDKNYFY